MSNCTSLDIGQYARETDHAAAPRHHRWRRGGGVVAAAAGPHQRGWLINKYVITHMPKAKI